MPTLIDLVGYLAAALVFLTFSMKTLMPLRLIAIASNVAFLVYGFFAALTPILILHGLLLPLNVFRTWEHHNLRKRIQSALLKEPSVEVLMPFMSRKMVQPGHKLFSRGDDADRLFYIVSGAVRIDEFQQTLGRGSLIGEVGLFTKAKERTATVSVIEPTEVTWIGYDAVLVLCQQHPEFALILTRLVAERMAENQSQLLDRLADIQIGNARAVHPGHQTPSDD